MPPSGLVDTPRRVVDVCFSNGRRPEPCEINAHDNDAIIHRIDRESKAPADNTVIVISPPEKTHACRSRRTTNEMAFGDSSGGWN